MSQSSPPVIALYLEYGSAHRAQLRTHLAPLLERLFPNSQRQILVIDNEGSMSRENLPDGVGLVAGDNSSREFSGWEKGLAHIASWSLPDNAVICLCNDTFARHYGSNYLDWFHSKEVNQALSEKKFVGYVDSRNKDLEILDLKTRTWIRSNLILAGYSELKQICPLTLPAADSEIFSLSGNSLFRADAPIGNHLRALIDHWLIKTPQVPGESEEVWYGAQPLTEQNRMSMQQKAKCILCELYLTAKMRKKNLECFDIRESRTRTYGLFALARKLKILRVLRWFRQRARLPSLFSA